MGCSLLVLIVVEIYLVDKSVYLRNIVIFLWFLLEYLGGIVIFVWSFNLVVLIISIFLMAVTCSRLVPEKLLG